MIGTHRRIAAAVVALLALALSACAAPGSSPSSTATAVTIPDTPVGKKTQWILDVLNAGEDTTAAEWEDELHESFLEQVSADEVADLLNRQVRPAKPLIPTAYRGSELEAVTTIAGTLGDPFDLNLVIDEDGLITGLLLSPAASEREPATSLGEVEKRFAALPADVRVLVTLDDKALIETDAETAAPLASVFKLYVLDAVAEAVRGGTLSWTDTVVVTDDARSLPTGELQDLPTGTEVPVREAAQKMIEISDNTATDLLIQKVGRDAVESAVGRLDVAEPEGLRPFPTTREAFALLWGGHDALVEQWSTGDEAAQRAVLEALRAEPFDITVSDVTDATGWDRGIEWFASAEDVTTAHRALHELGRTVPEVRDILGANPGIQLDRDDWPYVAFKGGSSPGVLTGSWLAERADGTVLTVVVLASTDDPASLSSPASELFGLVQDVFALTAKD